MADVVFDEEVRMKQANRGSQIDGSTLVGWFVKKGIAKNKDQAYFFVLVLLVGLFAAGAYFFARVGAFGDIGLEATGERPLPQMSPDTFERTYGGDE